MMRSSNTNHSEKRHNNFLFPKFEISLRFFELPACVTITRFWERETMILLGCQNIIYIIGNWDELPFQICPHFKLPSLMLHAVTQARYWYKYACNYATTSSCTTRQFGSRLFHQRNRIGTCLAIVHRFKHYSRLLIVWQHRWQLQPRINASLSFY